MNLDNIFAKKEIWEEIECPICDVQEKPSHYRDISSWEYKGVYKLSRCTKCGLIFQTPRIKNQYACLYYQSEKYWGVTLPHFSRRQVETKNNFQRYKQVYKRYQERKPGRMLDVGCGTGEFLDWFKCKGWETVGTDISLKPLVYAKKTLGLEVIHGDLLEIDQRKKTFDLVSTMHVFEHLYEPRKSLKKISTILKDSGELIITIPNHESLGRILFGASWFQYQPGRHIFYYTPDTIKRMLSLCGFEVVDVDYWTKKDSLYSIYQSIRYTFSPKFRKSSEGGIASGDPKLARVKREFSLTYEVSKGVASIITALIFVTEYFFGLSEVITVYAKKA
jgi:ubiquinone/menaquinone biosynthesis C-methylase UbiE